MMMLLDCHVPVVKKKKVCDAATENRSYFQ